MQQRHCGSSVEGHSRLCAELNQMKEVIWKAPVQVLGACEVESWGDGELRTAGGAPASRSTNAWESFMMDKVPNDSVGLVNGETK